MWISGWQSESGTASIPFYNSIQSAKCSPDAIPGSAPYSGPKAAQVFVGPMAGCAGGQSARAGGSWHFYYSWHGPVQCSVTSLHWKLNLNLAFEQVAARSTSWRSSARWEVAASPDPQMPNSLQTLHNPL